MRDHSEYTRNVGSLFCVIRVLRVFDKCSYVSAISRPATEAPPLRSNEARASLTGLSSRNRTTCQISLEAFQLYGL